MNEAPIPRLFFVAALLWMSGFAGPAQAGGFADFLLGKELSARTYPAVATLPAVSRSEACMGCHDGSNGTRIVIKGAGGRVDFGGHLISTNHPMGMNYDEFAARSPGFFVAPSRMDPRIELEGGQVTCLSCHVEKGAEEVPAQDRAALGNAGFCTAARGYTTGPTQTRLCLSCHLM